MAIKPGNNRRGNPRGTRSTKESRRAEAELMWQDRINGMSNVQIAEKYNIGARTVTLRFKEFPKEGVERSMAGFSHYGLQSEAAEMWEDKVTRRMSNEQIAQKHGVAVETVRSRLSGFFPRKTQIALEMHRLREDDKLDMLEEEMMVLLNKVHYVVDRGQVVLDPKTGQPLVDSEPKFKAVDRMLKIIEAKRKLFGLDAPVKAEVKHTADTQIQVQEVTDAVAEAHRKNKERLAQIKGSLGLEPAPEDAIVDAEVVDEVEQPDTDADE